MVLVPFIIAIVAISLGNWLIASAILVVCYSLLGVIGFYKRKEAVNNFYKIKDAHTKFHIINVSDEKIVKDLYNNSALTFPLELDEVFLDFIYNWLNFEKVLKEDFLNLYVFSGTELKKAFGLMHVSDNAKFMSIFLKDLNLNNLTIQHYNSILLLILQSYLFYIFFLFAYMV